MARDPVLPATLDEADRWAQQVRKGSTKLAVIQLLSEGERYGYEIVVALKERTRGDLEVAEGNVYPTLHALEKEGHVASRWRDVEPGVPPRKYYRLTPSGLALHARLVEEWRRFSGAVARILKGDRSE